MQNGAGIYWRLLFRISFTESSFMERLFVYGTLQPGGPNEHILTAIGGTWAPAMLKGTLQEAGWGASMGYPGLVLDEKGREIQGYVLSSENLSHRWTELDKFEGEEYERVLAPITILSGEQVQAYVYVLRNAPPGDSCGGDSTPKS